MNENYLVKQANYLIENKPKMTKDETRLFLTIVSMVKENDKDFKTYKIPVLDFADLWGIDINSAYYQIKAALTGLNSKVFILEEINPKTNKMKFFSSSYISSASYEQGSGFAEVEISQAFKPYLLALGEQYTRYKLSNMVNLTGVNSMRLYELLAQYKNSWNEEREISILEFKKMLGLENKYSLKSDLIRFVVEPSVKEINELTDLFVSFDIKGRGKKAELIFSINKKNTLSKEKDSELLKAAQRILVTVETDRTAEEYIAFLKTTINLENKNNKNAYLMSCILNKDNLDNFINQITMEIEKDKRKLEGQAELDEILRKYETREI